MTNRTNAADPSFKLRASKNSDKTGNPGKIICRCGSYQHFEIRKVSDGGLWVGCTDCEAEYRLVEVVSVLNSARVS